MRKQISYFIIYSILGLCIVPFLQKHIQVMAFVRVSAFWESFTLRNIVWLNKHWHF